MKAESGTGTNQMLLALDSTQNLFEKVFQEKYETGNQRKTTLVVLPPTIGSHKPGAVNHATWTNDM